MWVDAGSGAYVGFGTITSRSLGLVGQHTEAAQQRIDAAKRKKYIVMYCCACRDILVGFLFAFATCAGSLLYFSVLIDAELLLQQGAAGVRKVKVFTDLHCMFYLLSGSNPFMRKSAQPLGRTHHATKGV